MQKFLRTLALMALMIVPWAANAQNNTITVADGTATNQYVPVYGLYVDDFVRSQTIYPASVIEEGAEAVGMTGGTISSMTFYLSTPATGSWGDATFSVKLAEVSAATLSGWQDVSTATTVYEGSLDGTQSTMTIEFTTPYTYNGGNLLLEIASLTEGTWKSASFSGIASTGASWQGNNGSSVAAITGSARNFIPKTTFTFTGGQPITCRSVSNLVFSNLTANSVDLTWADLNNTGATYSIYNGEQLLGTVAAGVYSYSVTGLEGNTVYTLSVVANCSDADASAAKSVTFRTECDIISSLPWTEGFESVPDGSYPMPYCWTRPSSGNYPYSYATTYSYNGERCLYLYSSGTTSYYAVTPQVDVTNYPMNANMVTFWARANNTTSVFSVEVGTMTDPNDVSTFTTLQTISVQGDTYTKYIAKLTNATATDSYIALKLTRTAGSYSYLYIDDLTVDVMPSCWPVTNLAVDATTSNSVTLSWNDVDNTEGVTYTVTYGDQSISGLSSPATITGLTANTPYTFSVVANCSANDASTAESIDARTLCDENYVRTLPYAMGFESSEEDVNCWTVDGNGTWTMGQGDYSTSTGTHTGEYNAKINHSSTGDATKLITPVIDLTSVESAMLTFWHVQRAWSGDQDELRVYYRTAASEDWTLIPGAEFTDQISTWTESRFVLPNPSATYQIAFEFTDDYGYGVSIDDIEIAETPRHTVAFNYLLTDEGVAMGSAVADNANPYWNSTVTLTSTPATNMRTAGWYPGNLTSVEGVEAIAVDTNDLKILVTSDTTITVVYGYGQFEIKGITANENQARMGSVAGNSPYNNDMYDYGTTATLTATPSTGFQFIEWLDENGDQYSTENPVNIEALQPLTLTAHFGIASYEVTAETEHGHVDGLGTYTFGTSVVLTAVADDHYHFVKWADDDMTNDTRAYRVIEAKTFHPVFEPDVYTVTVSGPAVATYTVKDAEGNETNDFVYTTEATVEATAIDEHYTFASWNVKHQLSERVYFLNRTLDGATVMLTFDENDDVIFFDSYGENGEHVNATNMTLDEANALLNNNTYSIIELVDPYVYEWSEVVATVNPYSFNVENNITLTPVFTADEMTLTIASNDADMGSVRFADYEGTSVTVDYLTQVHVIAEAVPGDYSSFAGWYNGTELVSSAADFLYTVSQPVTLTAHFEFAQYPVTVAAEPVEAGTVDASSLNPQFSDNVTFTATANDHWVFSHWTYADQDAWLSQNTEYSEMVFEALNLVAHFVRDNHTIVANVADETHGTTVVTDENGVEATEPFTHDTYATVTYNGTQEEGQPGYGYSFAGWVNQNDELVSTETPFTFQVTEDTVLTATVNPLPYYVSVDVADDENGNYPGHAFVNEADASFQYPYLTEVESQLSAEPAYGYVFANWTNVNGETVELPMVLTKDTVLTANFAKTQFTVTGSVDADYRMMGRVAGTAAADYLEYVTLTANENTGYNFSKWVDAEGNDIDFNAEYEDTLSHVFYPIYIANGSNSIDVLASEDRTVKAVYDYEYYTVAVATNDVAMGNVSINGDFVASKELAYSQTVTLDASAKEHYHFVEWQDENTDNPRTFILTEPVTYTATFAIDRHNVTFEYAENKVESISGDGEYDYGTDVTVDITAAYGFTFMGWSTDGENIIDANHEYTFTLEGDIKLMPVFSTNQYTVTVASANDAQGSAAITGDATVDYEGTTTIKATANYGYDFVNWTNNLNSDVLTDAEANVQVLDDITYTAHFQVHQFTMTALVNDEAMGGVGIGLNDPNAQPVDAEITVADGANSNQYVPVYGMYMDTYGMKSQAIYPATMLSDIPAGSAINSLTFYTQTAATAAWTGTVEVKLAETANESYSSATFADVSGATTVYTGTLDATGSTMTITFDAPYTYNGGNLLYDLRCVNAGNYKSAYFYGVSQSNASVYFSGSTYGSTTKQNFLPKTTFGYSYVPGPTVSNFTAEATATGAYNTEANFKAQPNYGYHFVDWTNGNDEHFAGNPETVTILRDSTLTANFAKNTYNVATAVQLNNGATGTVTITGTTEDNITVEYLDSVTLTANVNEPFRLLRWENEDGTSLGNANPLTFAVTGDSTITAVLDFEVYTLTANTEDIEMGGVYVNDPNNAPAPVEIFNETFESLGDWTMNNCNSSTGINSDRFRFKWTTNPPQYLISPEFNAAGDLTVSFNYWSASYPESFEFGYSTTDNDPSSFTWETEVSVSNTSAAQYSTTVPAATKYMAIKCTSYDQYYLYIDDFVVLEAPAPGSVPSLATSSADVDFSTPVAVTATPNEHYHFVGWKGAHGDTVTALGTDANPTITVAGDSTLTALFDGDPMTMTYQVNNAVRGAVEGPATAEYNTEVIISAVPAHGYEFTAWEDDATAAATRTVTVAGTNEENTYKAIFGFQTYPLEVAIENGTVSVTNDVADVDDQLYTDVEHFDARYFYGSELELTFTANEHYHFVENGSTTLVKTVSFLEAPEAINLVAVIDTHNVTLAVNDPALGTIEGAESGDYAYGTELTFTATPAEHQHFVNWSDGVEDAERTITVGDDDITLTANFFVNSYEVIAEADAEQGTATWDDGFTGNLVITVNDSYDDGWQSSNLSVMQNNEEVLNVNPGSGTNGTTYTYTVDTKMPVEFVWNREGNYDYEASFVINYNGEDVYTQAANTLDAVEDGAVLFSIPAHTTVLPNTNVTFTATPNLGYEFVNWTNNGEEVSTEASFSMPIVENTTLTANFNFVGFAVTVASNNDVMGTAYINDAAEQTSYVAAYEEEVVLTAVPAEYGYDFINWTLNGTEVSTENPATVQITDNANYVANFNFHDFALTVVSDNEERGTATGSGIYPYGTQVEISAVANEGFTFLQWNDGNTNATRTVTVDGEVTYTASFRTDAEYTVTVIAEHGAVTGNAGTFYENQVATLFATPATGYGFAGWYDETNTTLLSEANPFEYTVTDNVTLTARFTAEDFTLTLLADATMGSVTGAGEYPFGTEVVINANANEGYRFVQWSDDVVTNPRTITITGNMEFTALFEALPPAEYYIGATAINGTVEGSGSYADGAQVTLTATPNNCYQFTGWMNGNTVVSTDNPYIFTATENVTLMAIFDAINITGEETQVACGSYTWNGNTYTASGDYPVHLTTEGGCDSTATLHLTINNATTGAVTAEACGSYTWNGNTYDESGVYTYTTTNANGCDSVVTLTLTINTPVNVEETAQACSEYTWNVNNQTYTESGVYTASITDANGCDATATLTLTISGAVTETVTATACGSYEWNGQTYDASGEYTYTTTSVNGCDSIVTLQLTVLESVAGGDSTAVACGSFEWNGEFYTQSGDYTLNLMTANGCDSTVTLHLTINQAVNTVLDVTACDTYTWETNGVEYTSTGTYLYTFENGSAAHCDSTVTLNLTINSSSISTIEATATGSYEWNGNVYTESGEYTFNGQTVNGCDSVVTLILTIETQTYTVTVGTNNAAMGNVNPAGTFTVAAGETFTATAEANDGFRFAGWSNGATTETVTITVESDTILTANFEAITYTISATSNDETMGTVLGSGEYAAGATVTLTAIANSGYHFVRWSDGTTDDHYIFTAEADVELVAYFEADPTGIEDAENANVDIYSADSKIIVKGAENMNIYVYDVNGRVVRTQANATETVEFTMNTTGVYLVKVGNAPAKRVVVVR